MVLLGTGSVGAVDDVGGFAALAPLTAVAGAVDVLERSGLPRSGAANRGGLPELHEGEKPDASKCVSKASTSA